MTPINYEVRPGKAGYFVGGGIIVAGIVAGIVLMATGVVSAINALPKFTSKIEAGSQQTVDLDRSGQWALFAGGPHATASAGSCMIEPVDGGTVTAGQPSASMNFTRDSRQWYWRATFTVSQPGKYQFDCTGTDQIDWFAVGDKPNVGGFMGRLAGGILALIGVPCVGLIVGVVLIIVTASRRSSARRRLQQAGPPTYPGYPMG